MSTNGRSASISLAFPTRNQPDLALSTLKSAVDNASGNIPLEFVVVDDQSSDSDRAILRDGIASLRRQLGRSGPRIVSRFSNDRLGVARARNRCAATASGDVLFITDGHVNLCPRWDEMASAVPDSTIYAGTIRDQQSKFHGYGCTLVVPFMGTHWVRERPEDFVKTQVAASPATILKRRLFLDIGGFDAGMNLYGAIEPEFSVRAWLWGAEILGYPDLEVFHYFKNKEERDGWLGEARPSMIHNAVRFGILYLPEPLIIEMLRLYAMLFPANVQEGYRSVNTKAAFKRRRFLSANMKRDFMWFCNEFQLLDQGGEPIFPPLEAALVAAGVALESSQVEELAPDAAD